MKNFIYILSFITLPICGTAQDFRVEKTDSAFVTGNIDFGNQRWQEDNHKGGQKFIQNLSVRFSGIDLVISFDLAELSRDKVTSDHYYIIRPAIELNGEKIYLITHDELRGTLQKPEPGHQEIRWINPLDHYAHFSGEMKITVIVEEWGELLLPYDCSLGAPRFTAREKFMPVTSAVLGITSAGLGQYYRLKSEEVYEVYENSSTATEAEPHYQKANDYNKRYLIMTGSGALLILTGVIWYSIKGRRHTRDIILYNRWCREDLALTIQPDISLPVQEGNQGRAGLSVKLSF